MNSRQRATVRDNGDAAVWRGSRSGSHHLRRLNNLDKDTGTHQRYSVSQDAELGRASGDCPSEDTHTLAFAALLLHLPTCKRHSINRCRYLIDPGCCRECSLN